MTHRGLTLALSLSVLAASVGCGAGLRRFPHQPVVWQDNDQRPFAEPPAPFYSSFSWDGADNAVFRPFAEVWTFETRREALNVNAMDEVADSSWYENRLSRRLMTPEEVARGACAEDWEIPGPWRIVGGKPDGANPGFQIVDAAGRRYLLKTEGTLQPERPGAADTIGSAIYYAAGYYTPCNRVVLFDREDLVRDPEATIERTNGTEEPLEEHHVEEVLEQALRLPDGRYRASVSQFIDGRPISPWRYHGTRDDDPNDVIPHEHRREVRGMYVLSAWTDHIDSRQENTLAAWVQTGDDGAGYVRHYMLDFGDCFGIIHPWDDLVRRFGHSGYIDLQHVVEDFLTLGLLDRAWHQAEYGIAGATLGYYDARRFVPDQWRPGYANNAYDRVTEADNAWMARIVSRFRNEHIEALVEQGQFSDAVVSNELVRILQTRRDRILDRWLTRLSPLAWPQVRRGADGADEICMQDLAVWSEIRGASGRRYASAAYAGTDRLEEVEVAAPRALDQGVVCTTLPAVEDAEYLIVDVVASSEGRETTGPARLHFYITADGPDLVGLERPHGADHPGS